MTLPDFSVLLLAWDEADPSVAVLGGTALPPTLSLVYQLAAHTQYWRFIRTCPPLRQAPNRPQLHPPAPGASPLQPCPSLRSRPKQQALLLPQPPPVPQAAAAAPDVLTTAAATPGVRLLSGSPAPAETAPPAPQPVLSSRVIGLEDLPRASTRPELPAQRTHSLFRAVPNIPSTVSARSQWPAGTPVSASGRWVAPAAPYAGASPAAKPAAQPAGAVAASASPKVRETAAVHPPPPPAPPHPAIPISRQLLLPNLHPLAGDLNFDPDPELPTLHPSVFDEVTEAPGAAELAALASPTEELTPDTTEAEAEPTAPAACRPVPAAAEEAPVIKPEPEVRKPEMDGLNFRMIEYARRAARLVRGRPDFGVIYAPNWPAGWLPWRCATTPASRWCCTPPASPLSLPLPPSVAGCWK